jgi:hypothetical protein
VDDDGYLNSTSTTTNTWWGPEQNDVSYSHAEWDLPEGFGEYQSIQNSGTSTVSNQPELDDSNASPAAQNHGNSLAHSAPVSGNLEPGPSSSVDPLSAFDYDIFLGDFPSPFPFDDYIIPDPDQKPSTSTSEDVGDTQSNSSQYVSTSLQYASGTTNELAESSTSSARLSSLCPQSSSQYSSTPQDPAPFSISPTPAAKQAITQIEGKHVFRCSDSKCQMVLGSKLRLQ